MAKEGSVAPKERINIVYKPAIGDAEEEVELPFRFLVLGDFTGREDDTPVEDRDAVGIDKDNFDDVLGAHDVAVNATVPNHLSDDEELDVSLNIKQMKDFSPDAIAQQVPELKKLLDLRDALNTLKGPLGNVPNFRRRLESILDDPEACAKLLEELGVSDDES